MENLEIISTQVTVQAKKVIKGNTANFSWNHEQGELPQVVNFNVNRGLLGEPSYTGNGIISGAFYTQSGKFDVQNNNFQDGDLEIYAEILSVCKEITENLNKTNAAEN
ncbi:hypothetical protein H0S70_07140 [Chryseobacterium manosquense]|uniref:Uncharacterized protein n=1 Tax=Chryseobacterium manosquense TaxID=2754694 RepID=A0A7H1DT73_9FLAO|nr:hypothetical protein [Chryseobacterium manosquense]QNS40181.1 hypothetical protein H0S70_07140 [Chryseobacterium manosquense]